MDKNKIKGSIDGFDYDYEFSQLIKVIRTNSDVDPVSIVSLPL